MNTPESVHRLVKAGIADNDAHRLRHISITLQSCYAAQCNSPTYTNHLERTVIKRLIRIMKDYPALTFYVQTDPRGTALYIIRPGDIPAGKDPDEYYNNGIAVYK